MKLGEHRAHTGEDGVVVPAFAVVAGAIFARQFGASFLAGVGQQLGCPLFNWRPDETIERALIAHVAGVEDLTQAANDARFGVGECSIEVEDESGLWKWHGLSFAESGRGFGIRSFVNQGHRGESVCTSRPRHSAA